MKHNALDPNYIEEYCHQVLQQKPMPGCDNKTANDYHQNESELAHQLSQSLLDHSYEPVPYLRFWLVQNKKRRPIDVPSIRDRILMRLVLDQLRHHPHNKIPKPLYGVAQKGWQQAIQKIEQQLQQNPTLYALKIDIKDYYPSIPHHLLKQRLTPYLNDTYLKIVLQWISNPSIDHDQIIFNQTHGVPQGIPIANALANIYLYDLDHWISSHNVYYVRYLDDLLIMADRKKILSKIKSKLPSYLQKNHQLTLNMDKIQYGEMQKDITYLGHGFKNQTASKLHAHPHNKLMIRGSSKTSLSTELAWQAIKKLGAQHIRMDDNQVPFHDDMTDHSNDKRNDKPSNSPNHKSSHHQTSISLYDFFAIEVKKIGKMAHWYHRCHLRKPLRTLYLLNTPARLRIEAGAFVIYRQNQNQVDIPIEHIGQIIAFGPVEFSSMVIQHCLTHNVPVLYLSFHGSYYGRLDSTQRLRGDFLRLQYKVQEDENYRLKMAQRMVQGRLHNARILIARNARKSKKIKAQVHSMQNAMLKGIRQAVLTQNLDQLRGVEGSATQVYWESYATLIHGSCTFNGRNRRPPQDEANSLISFLAVLLSYNIYSIIELCGLSPYVGFLHQSHDKKPALAFDLIEEFRAPIIEGTVLKLINHNMVKTEDFEQRTSHLGVGVFLKRASISKVLVAFENTLSRSIKHPLFGIQGDYRRMIHLQVLHLVFCLQSKQLYQPFKIR